MVRRWKESAFPFTAAAKVPATLAAGDVTGNLPADVQTVKQRAVTDVGAGNTVYLGTVAYAVAGAQMDLVNAPNATALAAIGAKVEAMVFDEADATALLAAISAKVETFLINEGDATATLAAIATAVRTNLATELGRIDAAITTRQATVTNLANAVTMAAKFDTMIVVDGAVYQFTANALELVPSGSGLTAQQTRDAMKLAPTAGAPEAGSVDKHLDDILEDTGTALPAQISALDIGSGTGTYACIWTVNDGATVLQGATVSFWLNGVLKGTGTTGVAGTVPMSLDAATYTVAITCDGHTFANTTHAVSGTASTWTHTFSMTANSTTPSTEPDSVTVRWRVKKGNRQWAGLDDATVYIQILEGPGTDGIIWHGDNDDFDSDTTDANGYVEFTNVPVPCTLGVRTGTGRQLKTVSIPVGADAEAVYDAGELISLDA